MADQYWANYPRQTGQFDQPGPSNLGQFRQTAGEHYLDGNGARPGRPTPGSSRSDSPDIEPNSASPAGPSSIPAGRATRIRVSKACTPCRRVKLKCNGETPCGRCSALNLSIHECVYPPSLRGKTRRKKVEIEADRLAQDITDQSVPVSQKRLRVGDMGEKSNGDRDVRRWDAGWTMRSMKEDFAKWKHDEELTVNGPRNDNIWNHDGRPNTTGVQNGSLSRPRNRPFVSPPRSSLEPEALPDRYTSSPFPGEGHNPLGVLAEASATAGNAATTPSPFQPTGGPGDKPDEDGEEDKEGPRGYGVPLERVLRKDAPHIMSLISISEAEGLFESYFESLHSHLPFLDREHSTPAALAQRNNFLFNAICCVAARATNPILWDRLKEFARFETARFPKDTNIDVVQGHLIYSVWNITGPKRFEQDKSWLRLGLAIRTALDINLHRVALSKPARQGLPDWLLRMIIRTWLLIYVVDRTLSAQLGKPTTLRDENGFQVYLDLISRGEGRKTNDDAWVSSLAEWTQVLGRVHDVFGSDSTDPSGSRSLLFQPDLVHVFQEQFGQLSESSIANARAFETVDDGSGSRYMIANVALYNRYARLIVHSFGLQRALDSRKADLPSAFAEYQISAIRLIEEFESEFESAGLTRGCPDFIFTFLTFGAVSLLKCLQPQYAHLEPDRQSLISLAKIVAGILSRSAATPDHLPAMQYSCLTKLIEIRSKSTAPKSAFAMIDFEAFGQSIDADLSKTPWPPTGPTITRPHSPSILVNHNTASGLVNNNTQDLSTTAEGDLDLLEQDLGWGMGMGMGVGMGMGMGIEDQVEDDSFGWLSGLGAGEGFFGTDNANGNGDGNEGDLGFTQDPFWKSILEQAPRPQ